VPLALGILLAAFGALLAAVLPVGLAMTAFFAANGLLALVSHRMHVDTSTSSVMLLIGLAVGVDYCLFYLRREREERAAGHDAATALRIAAATSGRSVLISGGSTSPSRSPPTRRKSWRSACRSPATARTVCRSGGCRCCAPMSSRPRWTPCRAAFGLVNAVMILVATACTATALEVALRPDAASTGDALLLYDLSTAILSVAAMFFGLWLIPMGWLAAGGQPTTSRETALT
jgi:hypothetical protein